jgi:6-phosphogluconate dehydrogenase
MKVAILGLGKMGSRIALKLYEDGHEVVVWNRSSSSAEELKFKIKNLKLKIDENNLVVADTIINLIKQLGHPRILWLMLPQGEPTQEVLDEVSKYLEKGDIVIDGGNAYFKDTQKRYGEFKKKGIEFLGIGVSGGILASKNGYPLMAGGSKKAYEYIKPLLESLSKPNGGYDYFGQGGAGHFVKMVHNGIEYGIMQSIGEGFEVLEKSAYKFDLLKVAKIWQKGTIISGFLLDRASDALSQNPRLSGIKGYIEESGEARWTVEEAKKEGISAEIIERSLEYRRRSQKDIKIQNSFTAKMVAALRNAFGGHSLRSSSRV